MIFRTIYVQLQEAYALERDSVGSWVNIGFNAPGEKQGDGSYASKNFTYSGAFTDGKDVWTATAKTKLNDCQKEGNWIKTAQVKEGTGKDGTPATVEFVTGGTEACLALTPSFGDIGNKAAN